MLWADAVGEFECLAEARHDDSGAPLAQYLPNRGRSRQILQGTFDRCLDLVCEV
jgi:hypothetical protein